MQDVELESVRNRLLKQDSRSGEQLRLFAVLGKKARSV
jgi:hypothetical protein